MSSGATLACARAAFADSTARSVAERSFKAPPKVPKGVRLPDRNQISSLFQMLFTVRSSLPLTQEKRRHHAKGASAPQQAVEVLQPYLHAPWSSKPRPRGCQPALQVEGTHGLAVGGRASNVGPVEAIEGKVFQAPGEITARHLARWAAVVG